MPDARPPRLRRARRLRRAPAAPGPARIRSCSRRRPVCSTCSSGRANISLSEAGEAEHGMQHDERLNDFTRRDFIKGGVSAFTLGFAAPAFLSDLARAQGAVAPQPRRAVSVRRQRRAQHARAVHRSASITAAVLRIAVPAGTVLQIGSDASGKPLGLHPRLTGPAHRFSMRAAWRSFSGPATRTPAGRTFSAPTSGPRPIPPTRSAPAGSAATSTRCRHPPIRWPAGARSASCRIRCWRTR